MKKPFLLLAIATLMITANGCGSCRGMFGKKMQATATPVYSQCAPTCGPSCGPSCNSCESGNFQGNAVTYGMPAVTNFSGPAMVPAGGVSVGSESF